MKILIMKKSAGNNFFFVWKITQHAKNEILKQER